METAQSHYSPHLFAVLDIEEIVALEKNLRDGIIKWAPDEYEDGATESWYIRENALSHQVEAYFDQ